MEQNNIFFVTSDNCFNERCEEVHEFFSKNSSSLAKTANEADMLVCTGGDGSLLQVIHNYHHLNKPILGINSGTVGFLMNPIDELETVLVCNKFQEIELHFMEVSINGGEPFKSFNEIMIGGSMNSWINFDLHDCDDLVGSVKGGGLIFSTPQGSTGINKNNGGPILPLESNLWSITGDKTERKISHVVKPRDIHIKANSRYDDMFIWIDGSIQQTRINTGDNIHLKPSTESVSLAFFDHRTFLIKRRDSRC